MRSVRFGIVVLLTLGAAALFGPAAAGSGCVELTASINPTSVCAGGTATVSASLTNCGQMTDQVTLTASFNGTELPLKATLRVPAGKTVRFTRQVTIPASASAGSGTLELTAKTRAGGEATADVVVSVTACN